MKPPTSKWLVAPSPLLKASQRSRIEISARRRPALSLVHGHVEAPEAFLPEAVHVVGQGIAGLPGGFDEGAVKRVAPRAVPGVERTLVAAPGIAAFLSRLGATE